MARPRRRRSETGREIALAELVRSLVAVLLSVLTPASAFAQEIGGVFRSGIDVVALSVVVTDQKGKFVQGLATQDFAVFEDGVRQPLSFFASSRVPIDLAILLDTSASMSDKMWTVQQAAIGFTSTLRSTDRSPSLESKTLSECCTH